MDTTVISQVNEYFQDKGWELPKYEIIESEAQGFTCFASFNDIAGISTATAGTYSSKKQAKARCADKIKALYS